jgi:trimeric autotransporter adhesin
MNSNPLPDKVKFTDPTQLPAMLWLVEGNVLRLYADPKGIPTIGIGVNVQVPQNMAVVLSQISVNNVNIFAAAAIEGFTVAQVVQAFESILAAHPLSQSEVTRTGISPEEQALQNLLDTQAASYFNETLAVFRNGQPAANGQPAIPAATATFFKFGNTAVQNVLSTLLSSDPQVIQGGSGPSAYGPYTINTYSQQLTTWLTNNTSSLVGAAYDVPAAIVPKPNTGQWEALLSLFYNQNPNKSPLIGKGLMHALQEGNAAQAWYQIRYAHAAGQDTSRRYYESQMFGLSQPGDTVVQALQAYEMLEENRAKIISYETTYGANPDSSNYDLSSPNNKGNGIQVANANVTYALSISSPPAINAPLYPVQTLTQAFDPEAEKVVFALDALYPSVLGPIGIDDDPNAVATWSVRSTNILVAPDATDIADGFATAAQDQVYAADSPNMNHLILGPDSVSANQPLIVLMAGNAQDVLIAGAGNEYLVAGSGSDTLIGGQGLSTMSGAAGTDTLVGGAGKDTFDFAIPESGALTEIINAVANQQGVVEMSTDGGIATVLGGSATTQLLQEAGNPNVWSASGTSAGVQYTYNATSDQLSISGGTTLGSDAIDIDNFSLSAAESSTGFMGIFLDPHLQQNVTANQGKDPPVGYFIGGSSESFTLSVDAPSTTAQNMTVTLSGALASDFEVQVGDQIESIAPNGTFNVTLAAGDTNVAYTLIDVTTDNGYSDVAQGGTLTLSASLADPAVAGGAVQATPISLDYLPNPVEPQDHGFGVGIDGFVDDSGTFSYTDAGGNTVTVGGTFYGYSDVYGDGDGDFVMGNDNYNNWAIIAGYSTIVTGTGAFNYVLAGANGATEIFLHGATDYAEIGDGVGTVYGGTGRDTITTDKADAVIIGDGGTDLILTNEGTNQIYADRQVGLAQAIAQTEAAARTSGQGDFISVLDGNNTVVGGTGDDLITAGVGPDVIVLGSGDDTFVGGFDVTDADADWSAVTTSNGSGFNIEIDNLDGDYTLSYENPYEQPYNGSSDPDTGQPLSVSNDTVFAGNGNDVIVLGNGSNYVQGGSGNDTIFGGMGGDTIYAGTGNTVVHGGGGTTYIYGGSGQDTLRGGDGNNVIIGGSGNSTITAAHGPSANYTGASDEQNYVFGGSGNDLITGSAGNDTLIAGSGNTTIQGGAGNESIVGGSGTDSLVAGSGNATIQAGGVGNDTLIAGTGSGSTYLLYGGTGVDSILGGSGTNQLYAGDGGTASASTNVIAGQGATTIYGGDGFDYLSGGSGTNVIYAGGGASTLVAGSGATTLYGGTGNDLIEGGSGNDVLYAGDGGSTTVIAGTGASTLYGGPGASVLQDQQGGSDLIVSVDADDTLYGTGSDTLVAGFGDDLLETDGSSGVTVQFNSGFGDDSVNPSGGSVNFLFGTGIDSGDFSANMEFDASGNSYLALYADGGSITIENGATGAIGSLTFADDQTGSPNLALDAAFVRADAASSGTMSLGDFLEDAFGGDQTFAFGSDNYFLSLQDDDSVSAGSYQDTIAAYGVNDTLVASTATSEGDSIYSAGDSASIIGGSGSDSIQAVGDESSVLGGTGVNYVTLSGTNALYTGTSGQDFITVSGTDDTVIAGIGTTVFVVNDPSAVIDVTAGSAADSIISSVSYTAPTNVNILTLTGTADISATGNAGNDTLTGGAGQDTLIAGSGIATLICGSGNTTFVVNNTGDVVVDGYGSANDEIQSSVNFALPTNVESLVLTGTGGLSATVNGGNDTIVTNTGIDTLYAGGGNDTFVINNPGDVIVAGTGTINIVDGYSGNGTLTAGSYSLTLTGTANLVGTAGPGNDTLVSNSGVDTLYGGGGNDTFVINNSADVVVDTGSTSGNIVISSVSYSLPSDVNTLILTGSAALVGTGNSATNVIEANSGNDTLISGTGLTTLIGGSGNDAFYVNNSGDVVSQTVSGVSDTIVASASTSLVTNVDTLVLTGTASLSGTVSSPDNDTLVSNSGVDTLIGGSGAETYFINNSSDVVEDNSSTEGSVVEASVSYTLPNFVTSLILTGTANLTGVANNDTDDVLTGNAGNDILKGGAGYDTLIAGSGVDTLVGGIAPTTFAVNNAADVVVNNYGMPDTVMSSVGYTLSTGVTALVLTGSANLTGTAVSGNNSVVGNAGYDVLLAGTGSDTLIAGSGDDTLIGGTGPDTFVINSAADVIESISGSSGNQIVAAINYTLPSTVDILTLTGTDALLGVGNAAADSITANSGNDTLVAGSGADTLIAGRGADLFIVNSTADVISVPFGSIGPDTIQSSVSFSLPSGVTVLQLTGTADLIGTGSQSPSEIVGNAGNDTLQARLGNSTLVAGTGLSTLIGSSGTDVFIINNTADVVEETTNGRTNILFSSVTYTLPANVDVLNLTGSANLVATGNSDNDSMTGNAGDDTLIAGSGNDTLAAGGGLDTFIAGAGNDVFIVNNAGDVIESASATGANAVVSSVSYVLPTNVNTLTFTGVGNDVGTGNAGNDVITGNGGQDTLIAGTGVDTLTGGSGAMVFVVNNTADVVTDGYSYFTSQIQSSVNYVLPTNVDELVFTGTGSLVGTANNGTDTLISNSGTDTLFGGTGTGSGTDTFVVNNSSDVIQVTATNTSDVVQAAVSYSLAAGVNTLYLTGTGDLTGAANNGNDTLVSNSGVDVLVGGTGNDTFLVNNAGDIVEDSAASANNTIISSVSYSLPTDVNTLELTGTASLMATGNAGDDLILANGGNDTLIAGAGSATLAAGTGPDVFVVDATNDVVQVSSGGANDTLESSVGYTLPGAITTLILTGAANLVGNAGSGNDTLVSNSGVDTLVAGSGADLIIVNNSADVIQNLSASDTVEASVNYTLSGANANLVLVGTSAISGTVNGAGDILAADAGNATLVAGGVAETLVGSGSNDTFVVTNSTDVIDEPAGSGQASLLSSVSYTLAANVDALTLTGTANATITGNSDENNVLTANSGRDSIVATAWNTTIYGGTGLDTLEAGAGNNLIYAGNGPLTFVNVDTSYQDVLTQSTIYGGSGADYLYGGPGRDLIATGSGEATVYGGSGDETIDGTNGTNYIIGGSGSNLIYGGAGTEFIEVGGDSNVVSLSGGGTSSTPIVVRGDLDGANTSTNSTLYGGSGADRLYGGPGTDLMYGGSGNTTLYAGTGIETLVAGSGTDVLYGGSGTDALYGGSGNATLYAGTGTESLVAGSGADVLESTGIGPVTYEINQGFGNTTIAGSADDIFFGPGIEPTSFTVTPVVNGLGLLLSDGTSSVLIDSALTPGAIESLDFADTGPITLGQLVQDDSTGDVVLTEGGQHYEFVSGSGQVISAASSLNSIFAFGNDDTLATGAEGSIDAYGNDDLLSAGAIFVQGSGDVINLVSGGDATVQGGGDTIVGSGANDLTIYQSSTVIQEAVWDKDNIINGYASYTLPTNAASLILESDSLVGASNAVGGFLRTAANYDTLYGGAGADTLEGVGSNDVLVGGSGAETYIVNSISDSIVFGSGTPSATTVETGFGYTLTAAANSLELLAARVVGVGNSASDLLVAQDTGDTLVAGSGNDTLSAPTGINAGLAVVTLIGGSGNDTFELDGNPSDVIIDTSSTSNNVLISSVGYTLPANVNTLVLTGYGIGEGNSANDSLTTTSDSDTLVAGTGNDTLVIGAAGNSDVLVAGSGSDVLEDQSAGQDTLEFNSGFGNSEVSITGKNDVIQFGAGISQSSLTFSAVAGSGGSPGSLVISGDGGSITVQGGLTPGALSGIGFANGSMYTLEQLLAPSGDLTVAGANGNLIISSTPDDSITAGSGKDTVIASGNGDTLQAAGPGTLIYAAGNNDQVTGGSGADSLIADGTGDTLTGGSGADTLIADGNDTLVAGTGNEALVLNNDRAVVQVGPEVGSDTIYALAFFSLPPVVNNLVLIGAFGGEAFANANNDLIIGNDAPDTFWGGAGADTFVGVSGANIFHVNSPADSIVGGAGDLVMASINYTLPPNIDNLELTGANNLTGTGNSANDFMTAASGFDLLVAGSGNDTLVAANSSVNGVPTIVGGGAATLLGGSGADSLSAYNGGPSDVLISGTGVDTLVSGQNQTLVINNSADVLQLETGGQSPVDELESSVSYALANDVADSSPNFGPASIYWVLTGSDPISANAGLNDASFTITGNSGSDVLTGGTSSNDLISGSGVDTLVSGAAGSVNVFTINNGADVVIAQQGTTDTIDAFASFSLSASVNNLYLETAGLVGTANANNDYLEADGGGDTLVAGPGNDTLVSKTGTNTIVLNSGFGNSQVSVSGGTGAPTVQFGPGISAASLSATAILDSAGNAALAISSSGGTVTLDGALASQTYQFSFNGAPALTLGQFLAQINVTTSSVAGASGNLILEATPSVAVSGGTGNDTIYAAAANDVITGGSGAQVLAALGLDDSLIGGSGGDTLKGLGTNDTLVAGTAVNTLVGGTGATDEFVVNSTGDAIQLQSSPGVDSVSSSVSYSLPTNVNILVLSGIALKGTANSSGADTLISSSSGLDALVGGRGNETFVVNFAGDTVQDTSTTAQNVVQAAVTFSLPSDVNTLILTGAGIAGSGNSAADLLVGGVGTDTLIAVGTSATTLEGGGGNNTFEVVTTKDVVQESNTGVSDIVLSSVSYTLPVNVTALTFTGTASINGSAGTWGGVITGNQGSDTLSAGTLLTTLVGGTGTDVFVINNTGDVVTVPTLTSGVIDTIQSNVSYSLPANVAKLTFTGTTSVAGIGNGINDTLTANSGSDTLTAGSASDVLVGGSGADLFIISTTSDTVSVGTTHGSDTVQSSISYTLPANVTSLTLTGSANLNGTGSSIAGGVLTANGGNDLLTASGTATTLYGGAGNDTFSINSTTDVVQDSYTLTTNLLESNVSYTLPTNVNILVVTQSAAVKDVGNSGNDSLVASNAADTLVAGSGSDTLVSGTTGIDVLVDTLAGSTGSDTFVVNNTADVVTVASGLGTTNVVQSSVTYSLPANLQYLMMAGSGTVTATGNSLTDLIVGNSGTDTLAGGTGIDMIEGGTGADVLKATGNQAALIGGSGGADSITGGAFKDFLAAGVGADTITSGATANVIAVNKGDGTTTIVATTGASEVLSLGAGIDTEALTFTKSGENLELNDTVSGNSIILSNWYSATSDQDVKTLQVIEQASASYNPSGTNALQNEAVYDFNFSTLVTAFNSGTAGWALSTDMVAAETSSGSTSAYGGDLAYYDGLNGNLTGMDLTAAQAALTNSSYATAAQTIDSWSSISGGSSIHLLAEQGPTYVDPIQLQWLGADSAAQGVTGTTGGTLEPDLQEETTSGLLAGAITTPVRRTNDSPRINLA